MYGHFFMIINSFKGYTGMKQKTKDQLDKIEKIVKHDLSNGKEIQKRLHEQIKIKGLCPKDITKELEQIKSGE